MLILHVTYKCKPNMREAFLERIRAEGIDEAVRAEDGNIQYDYYIPTDGRDELLLLEKWRDADALAAHAAQPHMVKLRAIKDEYTTDTLIEKYPVQA